MALDLQSDTLAAVRDYYERTAHREARRLDGSADGSVEAALHARAFGEHLPAPPARVLDLGGGPGYWTRWLAERGYRVVLADLSPPLLALARERLAAAPAPVRGNVEAVLEVDARDLREFADGSFDAVLSLGPFYHLADCGDRNRAAAELRRVVRPGGRLFAALMPRYMRLVKSVLEHGSAAFDTGTVQRIVAEGSYRDERPGRFTGGHLVRPAEVAPFFARHGFRTRRLMASQGFLGWVQRDIAGLAGCDPAGYAHLLDVAYATADDASILGMAGHLLFIGDRWDGPEPIGG